MGKAIEQKADQEKKTTKTNQNRTEKRETLPEQKKRPCFVAELLLFSFCSLCLSLSIFLTLRLEMDTPPTESKDVAFVKEL